MNFDMIWGVLRHLLTFGGGYLVQSGLASADDLAAAVGGFGAVLGLMWSIVLKRKTL